MDNKFESKTNSKKSIVEKIVIVTSIVILVVLVSIVTYIKNNASEGQGNRDYTVVINGVVNDDALKTGWGDNIGGRNMYSKHQVYDENALGDTITFNSLTDNMDNGGDERNFVIAKKDKGFDPKKGDLWSSDVIAVDEEEIYTIAMYVHNDNPNGINAMAEDVVAHVTLPLEAGRTLGVQCSIDSSNAVPTRYWDGVNFKSDRDFVLEYIEGSAVVKNNGIGKDSGYTISDNLITSYGVPLGYEQLDGRIPGGSEYELYVEFKVQPVFVK